MTLTYPILYSVFLFLSKVFGDIPPFVVCSNEVHRKSWCSGVAPVLTESLSQLTGVLPKCAELNWFWNSVPEW